MTNERLDDLEKTVELDIELTRKLKEMHDSHTKMIDLLFEEAEALRKRVEDIENGLLRGLDSLETQEELFENFNRRVTALEMRAQQEVVLQMDHEKQAKDLNEALKKVWPVEGSFRVDSEK